jgi:hypothetical protein
LFVVPNKSQYPIQELKDFKPDLQGSTYFHTDSEIAEGQSIVTKYVKQKNILAAT